MSSPVFFQVISVERNLFSPIIYGHWAEEYKEKIIAGLKQRMRDRHGDVSYTAARLVQELCNREDLKDKDYGVGIRNAEKVWTEEEVKQSPGTPLVTVIVEQEPPHFRYTIIECHVCTIGGESVVYCKNMH